MHPQLKIRPPPKGFGSQLILVVFTVALMLGGIYVGSFVTHFLWVVITAARAHGVQDSPAWLVIPSFAIAIILFIIVARWLRLMERLLKASQKK